MKSFVGPNKNEKSVPDIGRKKHKLERQNTQDKMNRVLHLLL